MSFEDFIYNNYEVKTTNREDHIRICCPNCGDSNFHGYVNTTKNLFKCWKCHWSHKRDGEATTAYYFLKEFHGLTNREIFEVLNLDREVIDTQDKTVLETIKEYFAKNDNLWIDSWAPLNDVVSITLPEHINRIKPSGGLIGTLAYNYIKRRFPDYEAEYIIDKYNLYYGYNGIYNGYIIIPVKEWGELTWYQGRAFWPEGKQPKYLGPTGTEKPIFGIDNITSKNVIITEGVFDAMTLGDNTLCVFGSGLSKRQMGIIKELNLESVTVWFDWDGAGRVGARKLCGELEGLVDHVSVVIEPPADANSLGLEASKEVILENTYRFCITTDLWLKIGTTDETMV